MIIFGKTNPRFPHTIVVSRNTENPDPFTDTVTTTQIYSGEGRSFGLSHKIVDGVKVSIYNAAIPKTNTEWATEPKVGDMISVTNGSLTESGIITDICKGNMGTNLTWEIARN